MACTKRSGCTKKIRLILIPYKVPPSVILGWDRRIKILEYKTAGCLQRFYILFSFDSQGEQYLLAFNEIYFFMFCL